MAKIITLVNQKGGVGKTTSAINLAACLAYMGQETLLIDMDPQANTTSGLGVDKDSLESHIYHSLIDNIRLEDILKPTPVQLLDLAPSNQDLTGAEVELVGVENRETRLRDVISKFEKEYKYIFVDCPPSLGLLTLNSLVAADSVIIPMQCEYYALEGVSQLIKTIELVQKNLNPKLEIEGVLFTMFDSRTNLSEQVEQEIRKYFGDKVYDTRIPRAVRLAEAPSYGKPIILYDRYSKGTDAYVGFAKEFIKRQG